MVWAFVILQGASAWQGDLLGLRPFPIPEGSPVSSSLVSVAAGRRGPSLHTSRYVCWDS